MKDFVSLDLKGNMSFDVDINGHQMVVDTAPAFGGNDEGPRPKSLMLAALGGCTGMDVVSILRKMKVPFTSLKIKVEGNLTEEHPKHFDHVHISYIFEGSDLDPAKIERAVTLSQDKYCGVSHNYRASMKITHDIVYK